MEKQAYISQVRAKVSAFYKAAKELQDAALDQYNALGGSVFVVGGFTGADITEQQFVDGVAAAQAVTNLGANETNFVRLLL